MNSLINKERPAALCPGCAHEKVTKALDAAFQMMNLNGNQIALVSDIGCSGLFDTFFNTNAMHGLHGRALTYAAGIKMAQPDLNVVVTMGDGGLGIGGAHFLAACRRNLNLTLLILNNFNFGMTGGQFSSTTPIDAVVGSGFLNKLEKPFDACSTAKAAGAPFVRRCSGYQKDLPDLIKEAIEFEGFSIVDIWGICPGRYAKKNTLTIDKINQNIQLLPKADGKVEENQRKEYGSHFKELAAAQKKPAEFKKIEAQFTPPQQRRQEIIILGKAGQRIVTAGEILCLAGLTGGLNATQKNDYPITVLRGHSVSELIISPQPVDYIGIESPDIIIAIADEGVNRRKALFKNLGKNSLIVSAKGVNLPDINPENHIQIDFKSQKIKSEDMALASLAVLAKQNIALSMEMLEAALKSRFKGKVLEASLSLIEKAKE